MKIDIVGSACTWVKPLSTSFIINDEILFDCPQGSFKTLMNDYKLDKIKYIIITHFHSDHFMDLHLVFDYLFRNFPQSRFTVIAPKGCFERLCSLFRLIEVAYLEEYLKERVCFIDSENGKKIKLGNYNFKCFKMVHGSLDAYGFIIDDGVKVGFTGDTSMCNNVHKILKKSKACFIDTANFEIDKKHLSVSEVMNLKQEYPDCKLHMVHICTPSAKEITKLGETYPKQAEIIEIE